LKEERNVKWILGVSVVMLLTSNFWGSMFYLPYYPPREPSILEIVSFYMNRIDILFLITTITTSALATTGFEKEELMFKVSVYLFVISMILFLASLLNGLFTHPW